MNEATKIRKISKVDAIVNNGVQALEHEEQPPKPSLKDYAHLIVNEHSDFPEPLQVISIAGEIISTPGNITTISGQAKSGKSAFIQPLIAGALSENIEDGFEGVQVIPSKGAAVIHIDTEQSLSKHRKAYLAMLKRAGLSASPNYFLSYNFLPLAKSSERQEALTSICQLAKETFGGIHLLVIDGIADLIDDVQEPKESTAIVNLVQSIATKYLCTVVVLIHLNPAPNGQGTKERGHLGSHLQRKSESVLQITSNGDTSTLEPKLLRMAGKGKIPLIQYSYDPGKGYHVFVGHKETEKKEVNTERYRTWAKSVLPNNLPVSYSSLVEKLEKETGKGTDSVKKYIKTMTSLEIIKKDKNGGYSING